MCSHKFPKYQGPKKSKLKNPSYTLPLSNLSRTFCIFRDMPRAALSVLCGPIHLSIPAPLCDGCLRITSEDMRLFRSHCVCQPDSPLSSFKKCRFLSLRPFQSYNNIFIKACQYKIAFFSCRHFCIYALFYTGKEWTVWKLISFGSALRSFGCKRACPNTK